jgi:hypothetical protein
MLEEMAADLRAPNQLCYYVGCFTLFVTYFVHNVSATFSYGKKELLDIRTAITHLGLDKYFFFNKQDAQDVLQTPDKANIPIIGKKKRRRYRGHRAGCLVRIRRLRVGKLPLPSALLANVQSLHNRLTGYDHKYSTNGTSKTVTSYVSQNRS